ncbi:MAG TPA: hypothetical protein VHC72_07395, partial [Bryobacteraceae bacterium]|nr:hypothetical protein [Bryobacteraceae bacterium]
FAHPSGVRVTRREDVRTNFRADAGCYAAAVDSGAVSIAAGSGCWGDSADSAFASGSDADSAGPAGAFHQYVGESGTKAGAGNDGRACAHSIHDSCCEKFFSRVSSGGTFGEASWRASGGDFHDLAGYVDLRANSHIASYNFASDTNAR